MSWKKWNKEKLKEDPDHWRRLNLARRYNLTLEDVELMRKEQKGLCAICQEKPKGALVIDHCHKNGKVRGLLCRSCNYCLGAFDNINIAKRLLHYIERNDV